MAGGRKREWLRKKMRMAAPTGGRGQQQSPSPRWTLRVRALSAALRRRRLGAGGLPRVDFLQILYENVVFYLLWVIESVIVLAKLCFFFLRFGFRL
ncbi:uncharacterized protein LOC120664513 [Panicum virgatum]|uniref:Uncharacterized protein n=1 Tax=Panicum virgatum TaxID=38727 RepID=A0A8T0U687_PANVG|nr:uncharacterized protein LOC120664513 [Panicum virgatum]KAG2617265.1 hypothetical protein PVAP13_3NG179579 [Panicum virgatum]